MGHVLQDLVERSSAAVVEERLWKRRDRKERGGNESIRSDRRCPVRIHFVEGLGIECAHTSQLVENLPCLDPTRVRRRREVEPATGPLWSTVTGLAVRLPEEAPARFDVVIRSLQGRDWRSNAELHEGLDGVPRIETAHFQLVSVGTRACGWWARIDEVEDRGVRRDAVSQDDESLAAGHGSDVEF